jgi:hypothetical protein
MAQILGEIAKSLASLLTKVQFWVALIIVIAIIAISGMIGSLATAPYYPEVGASIQQFALAVIIVIAMFGAILAYLKYGRK